MRIQGFDFIQQRIGFMGQLAQCGNQKYLNFSLAIVLVELR